MSVTALKMGQKGTLGYFVEMYEEEIVKDRNGKPIRVKNRRPKEICRKRSLNMIS